MLETNDPQRFFCKTSGSRNKDWKESTFDFGFIEKCCLIVWSSLSQTIFYWRQCVFHSVLPVFSAVFSSSFISHKMFSPTRSHSMPVLAEKWLILCLPRFLPPSHYGFFSTLHLTSTPCYLLPCNHSSFFFLDFLSRMLFCLFKSRLLIMVLCSVQFCVSWTMRLKIIIYTSHFKTTNVTEKGNLITEMVESLHFDSSIQILCCDCFAFSPRPR